ncbi:hypothetical protein GETHLI_09360 [Geothrix limicola]|uniref:Uncharacterized protein n=1 Tax=Geothrix limicola TaxID=2927978 RepID=A0ABQ5QEG5_9BACT|nr:hypothetical protein [Geothrix limicola]GLH72434.1 hypothetical protein GETHLI_09360 [Geothrix limicola]
MLVEMLNVEPWIPPASPDLAILAMAAADEAGIDSLRAWPEVRKGGIGFGTLPPFLCWRGLKDGACHLVLLQAREVGALVPGARMAPLPGDWFEGLDLEALARPLARHPDFPGGASVHVVHLPGGESFRVRTFGCAAPDLVAEVLKRTSHIQVWNLAD